MPEPEEPVTLEEEFLRSLGPKVPQSLPPIVATPEPKKSKRSFDPILRKQLAEAQELIRTQIKTLISGLQGRKEFSQSSQLRLHSDGRVTIKSPEGAGRVFTAIIDRILTSEGAEQTQTAIRETVQAWFPVHNVTKDWTKPLPAWAREKIKTKLYSLGEPFASIKVGTTISLSALHKAAKAAVQRQQEGAITFKATVSISDDTIHINGIAAAISITKAAGGKSYRYARINIDKLVSQQYGTGLAQISKPVPKRPIISVPPETSPTQPPSAPAASPHNHAT